MMWHGHPTICLRHNRITLGFPSPRYMRHKRYADGRGGVRPVPPAVEEECRKVAAAAYAQRLPLELVALLPSVMFGSVAGARANPPLSRANPPLSCVNPPLSRANPPLSCANPTLLRANPPLSCANPPLSRANPPLSCANPPLSRANPPFSCVNPPLSRANPLMRPIQPCTRGTTLEEGSEKVVR
eukprot:1194881-Prorocentrum_minimum.AAC.2